MTENPENNHEKPKEYIPSPEEVKNLLERFIEGKEYEVLTKREDKKGLCLWEVKVPTGEGEHTEYAYIRKGRHDVGQQGEYDVGEQSMFSAINMTFFQNDIPVGGWSVAKCIDGKWKETP
ncbi:MAG: hypothetical protein HN726_01465 [Candidatus Magasanikbacteria bacterium]|jgi:hypothetical protein|nr:hypothetical protein [Candidatus Magasanikbacteria bacterium]MBT4221294.1 hypothetical protein [Candidatus Magasanikbacteria bacterium]MBT4350440.1 hypothetical protein [Candidatus Magasanikbacteria bacterium]MBT4542013.1 hypothetical protein [Candidatus Magasanikbacteria bacterium]MBT6253418.1 hypothetical protein [Candidatus Magasanikbacteria bacterium]